MKYILYTIILFLLTCTLKASHPLASQYPGQKKHCLNFKDKDGELGLVQWSSTTSEISFTVESKNGQGGWAGLAVGAGGVGEMKQLNIYASFKNSNESTFSIYEYYSIIANYTGPAPPLFPHQKLTGMEAKPIVTEGIAFSFSRPLSDEQSNYLAIEKGKKYRLALAYKSDKIPSQPHLLEVHDNYPDQNRKEGIDLLDENANLCSSGSKLTVGPSFNPSFPPKRSARSHPCYRGPRLKKMALLSPILPSSSTTMPKKIPEQQQQQQPRVLGEKTFFCSFDGCGKYFSTLGNLKTHQLIHSNTRPHKCTFPGCDSDFRQAINLKAHMRTHTGERPFLCLHPDCNKLFTALSSVRRHVRHYHSVGRKIPPGSYMDMTKSVPCANGERRRKTTGQATSGDDGDEAVDDDEDDNEDEEEGTTSDDNESSVCEEDAAARGLERKRKRDETEQPATVAVAAKLVAAKMPSDTDSTCSTTSSSSSLSSSSSPPPRAHLSPTSYLETLAIAAAADPKTLQPQGPVLFNPPPVFWPIVNSPVYLQHMVAWSNAVAAARSSWVAPQQSTSVAVAAASPTTDSPSIKKLAISTLLN